MDTMTHAYTDNSYMHVYIYTCMNYLCGFHHTYIRTNGYHHTSIHKDIKKHRCIHRGMKIHAYIDANVHECMRTHTNTHIHMEDVIYAWISIPSYMHINEYELALIDTNIDIHICMYVDTNIHADLGECKFN